MLPHVKRRSNLFSWAGKIAFAGFVLFVTFRILTPPKETVTVVTSPDGKREARLRRVYYTSQGWYLVEFRAPKKRLWKPLFRCPSPEDGATPRLRWRNGGRVLSLELNGSNLWRYSFDASSR